MGYGFTAYGSGGSARLGIGLRGVYHADGQVRHGECIISEAKHSKLILWRDWMVLPRGMRMDRYILSSARSQRKLI